MRNFTLANVRAWIDEYTAESPDGVDAVAFVLNRLGRAEVEAHAQAAGLSLGPATAEIEATIGELLQRKYPGSRRVDAVPVNPERWPDLVPWVERYGAYRIARDGDGSSG